MLCVGEGGKRYIVQFRYEQARRRRMKTTCSIRPVGTDIEDAKTGTVTLDTRDTHVKSKARKRALAKAFTYTNFDKLGRTAIWDSFFEQAKQ